jgi:hypothetical protein
MSLAEETKEFQEQQQQHIEVHWYASKYLPTERWIQPRLHKQPYFQVVEAQEQLLPPCIRRATQRRNLGMCPL